MTLYHVAYRLENQAVSDGANAADSADADGKQDAMENS